MRASLTAVLIPLALLMAAAKPVAPGSGVDPRASYRSQGVASCVRELSPTPGMSEDGMQNFCGCTLDTYMTNLPIGALPAQDTAAFRTGLDPALNICILRLPAVQAAQMRLRIYSGPPTPTAAGPFSPTPNPAPAPVVPLTPIESADAAPSGPSGPGLAEQIQNWAGTLPIWGWVGIAMLVLFFLFRILFRRDDPRDMIGPPPSVRQAGPIRPRETDRL